MEASPRDSDPIHYLFGDKAALSQWKRPAGMSIRSTVWRQGCLKPVEASPWDSDPIHYLLGDKAALSRWKRPAGMSIPTAASEGTSRRHQSLTSRVSGTSSYVVVFLWPASVCKVLSDLANVNVDDRPESFVASVCDAP